jgi:hypothetical protein
MVLAPLVMVVVSPNEMRTRQGIYTRKIQPRILLFNTHSCEIVMMFTKEETMNLERHVAFS